MNSQISGAKANSFIPIPRFVSLSFPPVLDGIANILLTIGGITHPLIALVSGSFEIPNGTAKDTTPLLVAFVTPRSTNDPKSDLFTEPTTVEPTNPPMLRRILFL